MPIEIPALRQDVMCDVPTSVKNDVKTS